MRLHDLLGLLLSERSIASITAAQYRRAITRLEEYLKRPATVEDLSYSTINGYLLWLESVKRLSAVSVRNYRIGIICLWNYAVWPAELAPPFVARRIRCPKLIRKPVQAWSVDSVQHLLRAASTVPGVLRCGISAASLLELMIHLGTETGLRPGDLRELRWSQIDIPARMIRLSQCKTGGAITVAISDRTIELLASLKRKKTDRVVPIGKTGLRKWESRLYAIALSAGFVRYPGQGLGTLRKTHATEVYRQHGIAAASESLGHRSGTRVVQDHYIDSSAAKTYIVRIN